MQKARRLRCWRARRRGAAAGGGDDHLRGRGPPALEAPAPLAVAIAVALDAQARRAQREAADRCGAGAGVDAGIARLDRLGHRLGRGGIAERESREGKPRRNDLQLQRIASGAPVEVEVGAERAGERRHDDAAQVRAQRRERQRRQRHLDRRRRRVALARERELAVVATVAEHAAAAEDDGRRERPGDPLGVQREVGQAERGRRARGQVGPVEAAGVERERGDADAPGRRRRCRCARAARRSRRAGGARSGTARARQRHARDRRRRPARRLGGEQEVDVPRRVAGGDDVRRVDVDVLQTHQALEWTQLVDLHLDVSRPSAGRSPPRRRSRCRWRRRCRRP
jgi:hypothetical protein